MCFWYHWRRRQAFRWHTLSSSLFTGRVWLWYRFWWWYAGSFISTYSPKFRIKWLSWLRWNVRDLAKLSKQSKSANTLSCPFMIQQHHDQWNLIHQDALRIKGQINEDPWKMLVFILSSQQFLKSYVLIYNLHHTSRAQDNASAIVLINWSWWSSLL